MRAGNVSNKTAQNYECLFKTHTHTRCSFSRQTIMATHILTHANSRPPQGKRCLSLWRNKSMAALINGRGFRVRRCTMPRSDTGACFYPGVSSSPPWPGNHSTARGCVAVTTGGMLREVRGPLLRSVRDAASGHLPRGWGENAL